MRKAKIVNEESGLGKVGTHMITLAWEDSIAGKNSYSFMGLELFPLSSLIPKDH